MPTTQEIETAQAAVLRNVYAPALFAKLSQYGIAPQSEDEAISLVKMAQMLRQETPVKAAASTNRFAVAGDRLGQVLGLSKQSQVDSYREAAVQLAADPELFKHAQLLHSQLN
jgi:hypothetical protein